MVGVRIFEGKPRKVTWFGKKVKTTTGQRHNNLYCPMSRRVFEELFYSEYCRYFPDTLQHCRESCRRHIFSSLSLMGLLSGLNVVTNKVLFVPSFWQVPQLRAFDTGYWFPLIAV